MFLLYQLSHLLSDVPEVFFSFLQGNRPNFLYNIALYLDCIQLHLYLGEVLLDSEVILRGIADIRGQDLQEGLVGEERLFEAGIQKSFMIGNDLLQIISLGQFLGEAYPVHFDHFFGEIVDEGFDEMHDAIVGNVCPSEALYIGLGGVLQFDPAEIELPF